MPKISVKDNKNNRWKGNAKTKTKQKNKGNESCYSERVRDNFVEGLS